MKRLLLLLGLFCLVFTVRIQAQTEVTPTVQPIQSIFDYDTCAPPCWMGLIPGESTSADVEQMFEENRDLIDPESIEGGATRLRNGEYAIDAATGLITLGGYSFDVGVRTKPHKPGEVRSGVDITYGVVDIITVLDFGEIPLRRVLQRLGTPDIIQMNVLLSNSSTWFMLIYLEPALSISLEVSNPVCQTSNLLDDLMFRGAVYFSPDAAQRVVQAVPEMPAQPWLTGYGLPRVRPVPPETWAAWMSGEVDVPCAEAWAGLPAAPVQPLYEVTAVPSATLIP